MPCGSYSPLANTATFSGLALPAGTRNTWTELDIVLTTNKSPFGATRIARVLRKSEVTSCAEKPAGTCGRAPAGIVTTCAGPSLGFEMGGRSCGRIRRLSPGLSSRQLPNAAAPVNTWLKARSPASMLRQQAAMPTTLCEYLVILYMTNLHCAASSARCETDVDHLLAVADATALLAVAGAAALTAVESVVEVEMPTVCPSARICSPLVATSAPSLSPETISSVLPKSRATCTLRRCTVARPLAVGVNSITCGPAARVTSAVEGITSGASTR